jgi:hypothetical protein
MEFFKVHPPERNATTIPREAFNGTPQDIKWREVIEMIREPDKYLQRGICPDNCFGKCELKERAQPDVRPAMMTVRLGGETGLST